jgi:hypothetical protein
MASSIKIMIRRALKSKNHRFRTPAPDGPQRPSNRFPADHATIFSSIFKCFPVLLSIDQCQNFIRYREKPLVEIKSDY